MQPASGDHLYRLLVWGFLATLAVSSADAGQNRWTPFGIGGGLVVSLAVDPNASGVVYAAAYTGGVYRSTDAARTWEWRGVGKAALESSTDLIVAPNDPQRLYATTQEGAFSPTVTGRVYTSSDGGAHWQELFQHPGAFNSVAASANGTLLVASQEAEVYRSADGGQTWTLVLDPETGSLNDLRLAFDPLAPETAYLGASGGLWQSTDSGATWRKIGTWPDGKPVERVSALAIPGTRPGFLYALMRSRLYRSEDGGLTWSGGAPLLGGNQDLAVDPTDSGTVYVIGVRVFVSHDGGDTATELPFLSTPHNVLFAIAVSPAAPATLYVATESGVAVSADAGEHWALGEQRGLSSRQVSPFDFLAAPSGRLYQEPLDDGVILRSRDRGASWSPLAPVPGILLLLGLSEEAGAPDHLWVTSDSVFLLFHSTNGGASWSAVRLSTASSEVASPAPRVVLAGGCGLQRTADRGRTWKRFFTCALDRGEVDIVHRLGVPPGWPGAVWAEVEARRSGQSTWKVLFSRDAGKTWRLLAQSTASSPHLSAAASRGIIYLRKNDTLQRSDDAGATWAPVAVPGPFLTFATDAVNPDILYLGTQSSGVLRSTDGGHTWSAANAGLAPLGRLWIPEIVADPKFSFTAYAFPAKGGIFQARFRN